MFMITIYIYVEVNINIFIVQYLHPQLFLVHKRLIKIILEKERQPETGELSDPKTLMMLSECEKSPVFPLG